MSTKHTITLPLLGINGEDLGPVLVGIAHIVTVSNHWDHEDVWTHCEINLSQRGTIKVDASMDQIEEAIAASDAR